MSAHCTACTWTGMSTQVRDGGRCPACGEPITYNRAPMPERAVIRDEAEFNRRAIPALRRLDTDGQFIPSIVRRLASGYSLTKDQQQSLFNVVCRRRREIADQQLVEFAEMRAKATAHEVLES